MRNITIDISDFQIFKELSLQSMFIPVVFPSTSMPSNMKNRSNIGSVVALARVLCCSQQTLCSKFKQKVIY